MRGWGSCPSPPIPKDSARSFGVVCTALGFSAGLKLSLVAKRVHYSPTRAIEPQHLPGFPRAGLRWNLRCIISSRDSEARETASSLHGQPCSPFPAVPGWLWEAGGAQNSLRSLPRPHWGLSPRQLITGPAAAVAIGRFLSAARTVGHKGPDAEEPRSFPVCAQRLRVSDGGRGDPGGGQGRSAAIRGLATPGGSGGKRAEEGAWGDPMAGGGRRRGRRWAGGCADTILSRLCRRLELPKPG